MRSVFECRFWENLTKKIHHVAQEIVSSKTGLARRDVVLVVHVFKRHRIELPMGFGILRVDCLEEINVYLPFQVLQTSHMTNSKLFAIRSRHLARDARRGTEMRQTPSKVSISSYFYRR